MTDAALPDVIGLLAHELRWQLLLSLAQSDYQVNELVAQTDQPLNLVSYHLKKLREGRLVSTRRSEADGRDVYYSLDLDQLRSAYRAAGERLHPGLVAPREQGTAKPVLARVLFVCTHNSARSQIAEGLMRHLSEGQVEVTSAGTEPKAIHPDVITTMDALGIDIRRQKARHVDEVMSQPFDTVITVCDRAREICPTFPGEAVSVHWGYPDPLTMTTAMRRRALTQTVMHLRTRIEFYLASLRSGASS